MKTFLSRGPIAVGLAVLLTFALFGIALAVLTYDPPTHSYTQTCSNPTPVEVGKVIITNTHQSASASGEFWCTDNGPEPNTWKGNWSAGPGQSTIKGCGTGYDLLTIAVYVDVTGSIGLDDIDHSKYANYCEASRSSGRFTD